MLSPRSFRKKRVFTLILLTLLAMTLGGASALLQGCAGHSVNENDPAALFQDAEEDVKSDHFQMAIDKFRAIKNKFPYSKYSVEAQLRIADIYFMQDSYPEAAASYEAFADLHPRNEKVPYALFRVGKSYYKDIPSVVARDLTPAVKALNAYNDFVRRFPAASEVPEAKKDIEEIRRVLAEKELSIGNFYFKREFDDSARPRFQKVKNLYPETAAAKEAEARLNEIVRRRSPERSK